MKKKIFLTESEKKAIILEREKAIVESFAKTFNKIKRIDEGSATGVSDMLITLDYDNEITKIEDKHYHNGPDDSIEYEIDTIESNFDFDDTMYTRIHGTSIE